MKYWSDDFVSEASKKYKRLSKGFNNYVLISQDDFQSQVEGAIKADPDADFYDSLYIYDETAYDRWVKEKTVAGTANIRTDRLVFDFDSKTDLELSKKDTIDLCGRLINSGIDKNDIEIYFSGGKGFHVELKSDEEFSRQEYKNIVLNFAKELPTLDKKLFDEQRIFRVPLTKHHDTGLYKILLSIEELNNPIDKIKEDAKILKSKHKKAIKNKKITLPDTIKNLKDV